MRTAESVSEQDGPGRQGSAGATADGALLAQVAAHPEQLSSRQVLQLQRDIGNRATGRIAARARRRVLQRKKPGAMIQLAVRFDRPLTREEFIRVADEQLKLESRGTWSGVRDHYVPEDSPVLVNVSVSLVKARRSSETAAELGVGLDPGGGIAGAEERAAALPTMSPRERQQLYAEIDRRYWAATGIPEGRKITSPSGESGNVAMWNQIRDEVLAQRAFVDQLPPKARQVIHQSVNGLVIGPQHYAQIVRIANQIERMDAGDLENYLNDAVTTTDLAALEAAVARFLAAKEAAPGKLKGALEKAAAGEWDTDSEVAALDADTMFYLSIEERIKLIREVAGGNVVGDEDERSIIRLLTSTPSGDLPRLLAALKHDGAALLKQLERVIDGEENKLYYQALRNIVFRSLDPAQALAGMEGARTLPWADPGLIKAAYNVRFHYETVEYTGDGKVRVVYWVNLAFMGMQAEEQIFEPDEIVGLHFFADEDFADAVEGETIYMPAANLLAFKNEQFSRELGLVVDIGLLAAGGVGLIAKGTRLARFIAVLDTAIATADIVIDSFRSEIAKTPEGKRFLKAWDTVNTLIGVYGLGRLVIGLPQVFRNLKRAYREFRAKPGDIAPDDLRKIDDQAGSVVAKADDALFEGEVADLRKRFSADVLAPFEPQLAKARGIEDAAKRKAAIADVESQVTAQQENLALVTELKKANPTKKNREIADLAAPRIRVPTVPMGMTAEEFQRAQSLIGKYLKDIGIKDAEGFATGSRITGITFNPTKGAKSKVPFGQAPPDFKDKDLDITLVTSRDLTNSETEALERIYFAAFKHELGIRNIVDRRQLGHIPIYGKIDLDLR